MLSVKTKNLEEQKKKQNTIVSRNRFWFDVYCIDVPRGQPSRVYKMFAGAENFFSWIWRDYRTTIVAWSFRSPRASKNSEETRWRREKWLFARFVDFVVISRATIYYYYYYYWVRNILSFPSFFSKFFLERPFIFSISKSDDDDDRV